MSLSVACVSGSIRHISFTNELPTDLPKELQARFEVNDSTLPLKPLASKQISKKKVKNRKKKSEKRDALVKTFIYPHRRPAKDPIWIGEKLVYSISYFGMAAGDFLLEVMPFKAIGGRKVYHFKGNAISSAVFSVFYRLNDVVESYFDFDGAFSHRFHIVLDESKQSRDALELNDSEKQQTFYWNRWHPKDGQFAETKLFAPIASFSQDSLSALYYIRTVDLPTGTSVTIPIVSEGKTWEAICNVVRREMKDTPLGRVQTIVIQPDTKFEGVLKKNGESLLWLTDDDRHIPVRLEAKVKIGTVVASLKKIELGINPMAVSAEPESSIQPVSPE